MSSHKTGMLGSLMNAAAAVKKSPQMIRKAFSGRKRMGEDKNYSSLDNCEENGWLHPDERITIGVGYKVTYMGSIEIDYIPNNPGANNKLALETARILMKSPSPGQPLVLTIASGRVSLTSVDGTSIIMRHSTSRIAYSTVDTTNKKIFCYVALSRKNTTPLCHVFVTASPRVSYELTFTCAQAFDHNYKLWLKNTGAAKLKASASESGDIDPTTARKSPLVTRKQFVVQDARPSPLAPAAAPAERAKEKWHPGDRVGDARQGEALPHSELDVEDDAVMGKDDDEFFTSLAAARSAPHLLDIGVDPEEYNTVARGETSA